MFMLRSLWNPITHDFPASVGYFQQAITATARLRSASAQGFSHVALHSGAYTGDTKKCPEKAAYMMSYGRRMFGSIELNRSAYLLSRVCLFATYSFLQQDRLCLQPNL